MLQREELGPGLAGGGKEPGARVAIVAREVPNNVHATPQVIFPFVPIL
jgi:hypothetical protein